MLDNKLDHRLSACHMHILISHTVVLCSEGLLERDLTLLKGYRDK